jgi:hypothetical protein
MKEKLNLLVGDFDKITTIFITKENTINRFYKNIMQAKQDHE